MYFNVIATIEPDWPTVLIFSDYLEDCGDIGSAQALRWLAKAKKWPNCDLLEDGSVEAAWWRLEENPDRASYLPPSFARDHEDCGFQSDSPRGSQRKAKGVDSVENSSSPVLDCLMWFCVRFKMNPPAPPAQESTSDD